MLTALKGILTATIAEEGCIRFELAVGLDDDSLYLVEIWSNEAALVAHHKMPYVQDAAQTVGGWLRAPTEVTKMVPVV